MPRVVIDTNVTVSALNFGGKPQEILELARAGIILNITSPFILKEIEGVLIRKFRWQPQLAGETVAEIKKFSHLVNPPEQVSIIDYPPDNRILECAAVGSALYIISGDRHLTALQAFQGVKIVDQATFLILITEFRGR